MLLFLIHPSLSKSLFSIFNCYSLEGESFLHSALRQECWHGRHLGFAIALGGSGMLVWVVGLPLALWLVLK